MEKEIAEVIREIRDILKKMDARLEKLEACIDERMGVMRTEDQSPV